MKKGSYIGVSGFMRRSEVLATLEAFPEESEKLLMVGILASKKSISGVTNKYPNRYPRPSAYAELCVDHPRALNLVHVATDGANGAELTDLLTAAHYAAGEHCHGVQINARWPDPVAVANYRVAYPGGRVVLQFGPRAIDAITGRFSLAEMLAPYMRWNAITDVLIDGSGGRAQPLDAARVCRIANWIASITERASADLGVGVAGGLCAEAMSEGGETRQLLADHIGWSIDAEGKLRDAEDHLDLEKTKAYVRAAVDVFGVRRLRA